MYGSIPRWLGARLGTLAGAAFASFAIFAVVLPAYLPFHFDVAAFDEGVLVPQSGDTRVLWVASQNKIYGIDSRSQSCFGLSLAMTTFSRLKYFLAASWIW